MRLTVSETLSTVSTTVKKWDLVLHQRKQQATPRWTQRASWLALVSLAWMQLAFASHQLEHSAAYMDVCDACVQLERLDDIVVGDAPAAEVSAHPHQILLDPPAAPAVTAVVTGFSARAPPVI